MRCQADHYHSFSCCRPYRMRTGEIHDDAFDGDLEKVQALPKEKPNSAN